MYRQIFTPTENNNTISFAIPREWYGQMVEIIVFPVVTPVSKQETPSDEEFCKLAGAWEADLGAEEMIAELKYARKFKEKDLSF